MVGFGNKTGTGSSSGTGAVKRLPLLPFVPVGNSGTEMGTWVVLVTVTRTEYAKCCCCPFCIYMYIRISLWRVNSVKLARFTAY